MTPKEALALIARALPHVQTDLRSHQGLLAAIQVINEVVEASSKKK